MTTTLTLTQVTKSFGNVRALSAVSLTVESGQRVALLGHNGAGKSTMMKIILGLMPADGGEIRIIGAETGSPAARAATAYLPENVAFHPALTGLEQMSYYLRLRGEDVKRAGAILTRVGLGEEAQRRRIGTYSKGMRQRVGLAQALIGKPRLLVLDEPTSGLDPVSRRELYEIVDELASDGAAILLSSHALTEVEARTDRIAILSKGVLVANDTLAALRQKAALPLKLQVLARPQAASEVAQRLPGAKAQGSRVELACRYDEKLGRLAEIAAMRDLIEDIEVVPPSLEDIYAHFGRKDAA